MKRVISSSSEDEHESPGLPSDVCLYLIRFFSVFECKRGRSMRNIRAIVALAACNQSFSASLSNVCKSLETDWAAIDWCNVCLDRETAMENGCWGSTTDCRVQSASLRRDGSDGLCRECARVVCGICWLGGCGCRNFEEVLCCQDCGKSICTYCCSNGYSHRHGLCISCMS